MSDNTRGVGMTNLFLRLPMRIIGPLYAAAIEKDRSVETAVCMAIEMWLAQNYNTSSSSTTAPTSTEKPGNQSKIANKASP